MRKSKKQDENLTKQTWKRKFIASLSMLLVSAILMVFSTYAWLVLSTAPEVSGITTNIGANGSLEIALLNTETRNDMNSIINPGVGNTISTVGAYKANTTWGNLIDLSDERYGMSNITLMPARLKVSGNAESGYRTDGAYLYIPQYDYDGRVVQISGETISAIYGTSDFSFTSGKQDYGVRAIGEAESLDSLGAALASARSNVATYTVNARNEAQTALENRGDALFSIVFTHTASSTATYTDGDIASLRALVTGLQRSLAYIEVAYRQALMGYAAANAENYEAFSAIKNVFSSDEKTLVSLVNEYKASLPASLISNVETLDNMQNDMRYAASECDKLTGGTYTWAQISPIMNRIMSSDKVYIGDKKLSEVDAGAIFGSSGEIVVTLAPGSGVPAGIADFAGNYSVWYNLMGKSVNITTETTQSPTYLSAISAAMESLTANDSAQSSSQTISSLKETYGYAIDLAFRTNATGADLLLQTDSAQRIYQDSTADATQGGGSYMEFSASSDTFTVGDMLNIMDAVRVGFVDDMNNILGIARLNTSNRTVDGDAVKAPLYLYGYTVDNGILRMDERRKTDATLTSLDKNVAKAVTAVVWLDGDLIDNTMVAAYREFALSGVLNLQFSTNVVLVPAHNDGVYSLQVDREGLRNQLEESKPTYSKGKGTTTTESWNKFIDAYNYAAAVNKDETSTAIQVANAVQALYDAGNALKEVTHDALKEKIKEVREKVGTTENVARLAYYYDGSIFDNSPEGSDTVSTDVTNSNLPEGIDKKTPAGVIIKNPDEIKTEDEYNKYTSIYTVDYEKNIRDEGNGVKSIIYTEESWLALANALYDAEAQDLNPMLTNDDLDDIITVLDNALKNLILDRYYEAYELNGVVYYFSLKDFKDDTYGQWYDSNFKRVVSDKLILDLDAKATPLEVATIEIQDYVDNTKTKLLPGVRFNDWYDANDEIIGLRWNCDDLKLFSFDEQLSELDQLIAEAKQQGYTGAALDTAVEVRNTFTGEGDLSSSITDLKAALTQEKVSTTDFKVPTGSDSYIVVNRIETPNTMLNINGENLNTTVRLNVWVLTKNGIVYKATKDVSLYTKAEGVAVDGGYETELTAGENMTSAGVSLTSVGGKETTETIRSYSWASSDTSVAAIQSPKSGKCTILGVGAGTATITVSVETVQGNTYTERYSITVKEAPKPEPTEEPTENP